MKISPILTINAAIFVALGIGFTLYGPNILAYFGVSDLAGDNFLLYWNVVAFARMFGAMLLSTRTAIEAFSKTANLHKLTVWTLVLLFIGGFPLGFAMNGYAFGEMWGGFPFGNDITDNKTLIAFVGWLVAFYMIKKNLMPKLFAVLAAILMLIVYMIPHSV